MIFRGFPAAAPSLTVPTRPRYRALTCIEEALRTDALHRRYTLDFSGLKMKLIGSIVAVSAISLLRAFMTLTEAGSALDSSRIAPPKIDLRQKRHTSFLMFSRAASICIQDNTKRFRIEP